MLINAVPAVELVQRQVARRLRGGPPRSDAELERGVSRPGDPDSPSPSLLNTPPVPEVCPPSSPEALCQSCVAEESWGRGSVAPLRGADGQWDRHTKMSCVGEEDHAYRRRLH
ncbi:hypothetical protein AAFF_G00350760 [Aldrovandia affinis]|uniref:Uncharacterized protein n=1 Tax=Aldrovandia affinis TaxID=143900 RepID=A0AAD7R5C9_9TELE|nr:hypothetical protein AAFF_G00350760 [Aldrovandia affinis]